MLRIGLAVCVVLAINCGDNRYSDPCRVACPAAPTATCEGATTLVEYGDATCDGDTAACTYDETRTNCADAFQICAAGKCVAPDDPCAGTQCTTAPAATCTGTVLHSFDPNGTCDSASGLCVDPCTGVTCTAPPAPSCTGATSTTCAPVGTCDGSTGTAVCSYAPTAVDCALTGQTCDGATGLCASVCLGVTCTTPPAPQCSGTTSISFGATGTCADTTGSPVCSYPPAPTDCTLTNQTCDPGTGLCADPCTLTSCLTPPPATCAANQLTTFGSPGTCGSTGGVPTCSYAPTLTDCGAGFCDPHTAACLADCGGSDCQTPPTATCSGNTLTSYSTPGTCDTTGAPTCEFATTATDCGLTGQLCVANACVGAIQKVRVQAPATITDVAGTSQTVTGRIFITGVTDVSAGNDPIGFLDLVELGVGTGTDPTTYTYQVAAPNGAYAGDEPGWDEYTATFT
ncbi:MAG: hypothetical protein ABI678_15815, partial [Kofleriaceae bacterium]